MPVNTNEIDNSINSLFDFGAQNNSGSVKSSLLDDIVSPEKTGQSFGEMAMAVPEVIAGVGGPAATWLPTKAVQFAQVGIDKIKAASLEGNLNKLRAQIQNNDKWSQEEKDIRIEGLEKKYRILKKDVYSPEAIQERGAQTEELLNSYLPAPTSPSAQKILGAVGAPFEWMSEKAKTAADYYIPENYPNARDFGKFMTELFLFHQAGKVGGKLVGEAKTGVKTFKLERELAKAKSDIQAARILRRNLKESGIAPAMDLSTPALRQQFIDMQLAAEREMPYPERTRELGNQSIIDASDNISKGFDLPEPPAPEVLTERSDLIRRDTTQTQAIVNAEQRLANEKREALIRSMPQPIGEIPRAAQRIMDAARARVPEVPQAVDPIPPSVQSVNEAKPDVPSVQPLNVVKPEEIKTSTPVDLDRLPDWVTGELEYLYNEAAEGKATRMHQIAIEILDNGALVDPGLMKTFNNWYKKETKAQEDMAARAEKAMDETPILEAVNNIPRVDPETGRPAGVEFDVAVEDAVSEFDNVWTERRKIVDETPEERGERILKEERFKKQEDTSPRLTRNQVEDELGKLEDSLEEQGMSDAEIDAHPRVRLLNEILDTLETPDLKPEELSSVIKSFRDLLGNERGSVSTGMITGVDVVKAAKDKLTVMFGKSPKGGSLYNNLLKKGMHPDDLAISGLGKYLKEHENEIVNWDDIPKSVKGNALGIQKVRLGSIDEGIMNDINIFRNEIRKKYGYEDPETGAIRIDTAKMPEDLRIKSDQMEAEFSKMLKMRSTVYGPDTYPQLNTPTPNGKGAGYQETLYRFNPETGKYSEPHYGDAFEPDGEPLGTNVVAHARTRNGFVEGDNVIFAEEVQSQLHQVGSHKGYQSPPVELTQSVLDSRLRKILLSEDARYDAELSVRSSNVLDRLSEYVNNLSNDIKENKLTAFMEYIKGQRELDGFTPDERNMLKQLGERSKDEILNSLDIMENDSNTGKVPNAPFKNSWHKFPLRDMINQAVQQGKDGIAWTTGKMQAARYNRFADEMTWDTHDNGMGKLYNIELSKEGKRITGDVYTNLDQVSTQLSKNIRSIIEAEIKAGKTQGTHTGDLLVKSKHYEDLYDSKIVKFFKSEYGVEPTKKKMVTELLDNYRIKELNYPNRKPEFTVFSDKGPIRSFPTKETAQTFINNQKGKYEQVWHVPITDRMKQLHSGSAIQSEPTSSIAKLLGDQHGKVNLDMFSPALIVKGVGKMIESAKKYFGDDLAATMIGYKNLSEVELKSLRNTMIQADKAGLTVSQYLQHSQGLDKATAESIHKLATVDLMPEKLERLKAKAEKPSEAQTEVFHKTLTQVVAPLEKEVYGSDKVLEYVNRLKEVGIIVDDYKKGSFQHAQNAKSEISKDFPVLKEGASDINSVLRGSPSWVFRDIFDLNNNPVIDYYKARMARANNMKNAFAWAADIKKEVPAAGPALDVMIQPKLTELKPKLDYVEELVRELKTAKDNSVGLKPEARAANKILINKVEQRLAGQREQIAKELSAHFDQYIPELAKNNASVRITLHAGDELPAGITLTPRELELSDIVRSYLDNMGKDLDKVGLPTKREGKPYIPHLWKSLVGDADLATTFGLKSKASAKMLSWKHQMPDSRIWYPDLHEILDTYIPVATKKLAFQPFKNRWDYFMKVKGPKQFRDYSQKWFDSNYYGEGQTVPQKLAQYYIAYQYLRLIGLSGSVAFKHTLKLSGSVGEYGASAAKAIPDVLKLPVQKYMKTTGKSGRRAELEAYGTYMDMHSILRSLDEMPGTKKAWDTVQAIGSSPVALIEALDNGISVFAGIHAGMQKGMKIETIHNHIWDTILKVNFRGGADIPMWQKSIPMKAVTLFQMTPFKLAEYKYNLIKDVLRGKTDAFGTSAGKKMLNTLMFIGTAEAIARANDTSILELYTHLPFINPLVEPTKKAPGIKVTDPDTWGPRVGPITPQLGMTGKDLVGQLAFDWPNMKKIYNMGTGKYNRKYYDSYIKNFFGIRKMDVHGKKGGGQSGFGTFSGQSGGTFNQPVKWAVKKGDGKQIESEESKSPSVLGTIMTELKDYALSTGLISDITTEHVSEKDVGIGGTRVKDQLIAIIAGSKDRGDQVLAHELTHAFQETDKLTGNQKFNKLYKELVSLSPLWTRFFRKPYEEPNLPKHWTEGKMESPDRIYQDQRHGDLPNRLTELTHQTMDRRVDRVKESIPEGHTWSGLDNKKNRPGGYANVADYVEGSAYYFADGKVLSPDHLERTKEYGMFLLDNGVPMQLVERVVNRLSKIKPPEDEFSGGDANLNRLIKRHDLKKANKH